MPRSSIDDTQVRSLRGQIGQAAQELDTDDENKKKAAMQRAKDLMKRKADLADENDVQRAAMESKSLNFTEFCDAYCEPLYEVKGSLPKCPPGYKFDPKQMQCVPKTAKDDVGDSKGKDSKPQNGPGYNVWGNTGINGDGYAWAEKNAWGNDGGDAPEAVPYSS